MEKSHYIDDKSIEGNPVVVTNDGGMDQVVIRNTEKGYLYNLGIYMDAAGEFGGGIGDDETVLVEGEATKIRGY